MSSSSGRSSSTGGSSLGGSRARVLNQSSSTPRFQMTQHQAAVKALAWCPWQREVLASGGVDGELRGEAMPSFSSTPALHKSLLWHKSKSILLRLGINLSDCVEGGVRDALFVDEFFVGVEMDSWLVARSRVRSAVGVRDESDAWSPEDLFFFGVKGVLCSRKFIINLIEISLDLVVFNHQLRKTSCNNEEGVEVTVKTKRK